MSKNVITCGFSNTSSLLERAKAFRTWALVLLTLFYEVLLNPRLMSRLGELYKPLFRLFPDDMTLYRGYRSMCMPKNVTRHLAPAWKLCRANINEQSKHHYCMQLIVIGLYSEDQQICNEESIMRQIPPQKPRSYSS